MYYEIQKIDQYGTSFDIIDGYFPEVVAGLSDDELTVLRHFDDYESHAFCVVNDSAVLVYDMICGDVYGRFDSLEAFRDTVLAEVAEEVEA